jgi:WhiB family redox-sensing transcriptional regulator
VSLYPSQFEPWMREAACKGSNNNAFFPERGAPSRNIVAEARKVCDTCSVKQECLDYAIANHEVHGVWGGMTKVERRAYSKQQKFQKAHAEELRIHTGKVR